MQGGGIPGAGFASLIPDIEQLSYFVIQYLKTLLNETKISGPILSKIIKAYDKHGILHGIDALIIYFLLNIYVFMFHWLICQGART